jgi:hypothetical protein
MVVYAVGQFSIIIQNKPTTLPSLSPVDRIREIPIRGHEQISTLGYLSAGLVQLYGRGGVVLLQPETAGALALVEYVRGELATVLG